VTPGRAILLIVIATLAIGAFACLGPEERIAYLFHDDAYYYLGVAKHLAHGDGSTFDGLHPTNGYHPLWSWMLVPLFRIVDDPGIAVRVVGMLWYALAAASAAALYWALKNRTSPWGAVLAAGIFALHPAVMLRLARPNGLETPLYALLLALFLGAAERTLERRPISFFKMAGLGILLGALILSRLDAGMFALAAAVVLLFVPGVGSALLVLASAASAVVVPVLVGNAVHFGSPMPMSERAVQVYARGERAGLSAGEFLSSRARLGVIELPTALAREACGGWSKLDPFWKLGWPVGAGVVIVVALFTLIAIRLRSRGKEAAPDALVLLGAGCALHFLAYTAWFWPGGEHEFRLYYFMPEGMLVAAALGACLPWPRLLVAAYAAAGIVVGFARLAAAPSQPGPLAERGLFGWVRHNLPQEAVLATTDAGMLGFFCGRPVVNLDGLINDERFLEALARGERDKYVAASPITHLVAGAGALHGWTPARPDIPPTQHDWMGTLLYEVNRRPGVRLNEAGRVGDWLVFAIDRRASEPR
jgi:hypothetical protein